MSSPEAQFINIQDAAGGSSDSASKVAPNSLPENLPILGLSDIVIFPGMVVPLLVESPSSIRLIDDVVAGNRFVGLVLQKRPELDNPAPEDLWETGCAGRVLRMLKLPDNTTRVLVEGLKRFHIKDIETREPYLRANCDFLTETVDVSIEVTALARHVREKFAEIIEHSPALTDQVKAAALNVEDPGKLADLVAANLNLELDDKQKLLGNTVVKERLNRLVPLLERELEILKIGSKIQKEVTTSMAKSQRDYFLREQIRAIQRELGEAEGGTPELEELRQTIEKANLPEEPKRVAIKEFDRLRQIPPMAAEYTVIRSYLDWIVHLPWQTSTADKLDLAAAEKILEENHHGLRKVKDRLLEFLAVMKLRQQIRGPILCLVGPPGVGKTSLGKSVADALGRKFVRIALGGMRDEAEIRGHRRTYVGALPGRLIQSLRRVESNNPVVLLDEIDKVGADVRGDPAAALLEVLDPHQNCTFTDHYLDLPFDLSRVLFLTTANWLEPVHPALRDRLEVIELPSYTTKEKLQIARRHLLPNQLSEHGLKPKQVRIGDPTIREVIESYTREAGVRQLDREMAALARKAAKRLVETPSTKPWTITISPADLNQYLGTAKYQLESAETNRDCGIVTGLAWTPAGGDILTIEATQMPGNGKLILTGSLGEVMKESAQAALSFIRSQAKALGLQDLAFDKIDLHIHVPAGATPKDGPSAGITIVVALASLLTRQKVASGYAMTGEISLRGRILPVGGIKEKVLAAARSGVRHLLLPEKNRKDWAEVPTEVQNKLDVCFVDSITAALEKVLAPKGDAKARGPTQRRKDGSRKTR